MFPHLYNWNVLLPQVPVDITVLLKPYSAKQKVNDIFEVEPNKVQIPPHDAIYVTVTFSPLAMQQYGCLLEVRFFLCL